MKNWKEIKNNDDICELLNYFNNFHDSCISSISYISGNKVNSDQSMSFGDENDYILNVTFESQWTDSIELCFMGVRRLHLVGFQDNYCNDIFSASIKFYNELMPYKYSHQKNTIVFVDDSNIDISKVDITLEEPSFTYIIAHKLKWKIKEV